MAVKFNPFTGQLQIDEKGSGGGSSYLDGEVQNFSALPETLGSPAVDSAYLVREPEGTWLLNRKPAGIYIRTSNTGTRASDWTYAGEFPDVFSDANFVLYDNGDSTKNLQFQLSGISTGTTRTITVPDKNITLDDAGDSRTPSSHASSHASAGSDPLFDQDLNTTDAPTFTSVSAVGNVGTLTMDDYGLLWEGVRRWDVDTSTFLTGNSGTVLALPVSDVSQPIQSHCAIEFAGDDAATNAATTRTNLGLGTAATADIGTAAGEVAAGDHGHGNINSSGQVGATANLPLKTGTGGIVEAGAFGTGAGEFAEGNHTHADLHTRSHAITSTSDHTAGNHKVFYSNGSGEIVELALGNSGEVLTSNGATSAPSFAAASGGDTVSIDASAADVLTATSGAISADDGGTIDSSDPFIKWDDTAGKLVYANPLSRPSGAFYVGLAPTTTALGANAINIQSTRTGATNVASGSSAICIGTGGNTASGQESISIGVGNAVSALRATAVGYANTASGQESIALGSLGFASGVKSVGVNETAVLRGQVSLLPFRSVYWGGQTTNNTATILNLDATSTNRFTIAANTALAVDILLVARRSDTADKWLVARRFLGIRRDGSNNTSLIGSVQTLGTDQSEGSPTWTFALTADDTNEALQLEVTGAASETVQWRATAFYRFV